MEALGGDAEQQPPFVRPVAESALQAEDGKMYAAGMSLTAGINALEDGDPWGNAAITINEALEDIARACIPLHGDGPWQ